MKSVARPVVHLRQVEDADLEVFFAHECDPEAAAMAGFPSRDRERFMAHWATLRVDPDLVQRTIVADGEVVGNIVSWPDEGGHWLGYWVGREWWGRGVATQALALLLTDVTDRPMLAHVVAHNAASIRVLERCGFVHDSSLASTAPEDGLEELTFVLRR